MADVSIIIPTKNEAECIGETLRTVTEQLKSDSLSYEILVVDDDSTDGTQDVVQEFYAHDKGVHLVRHPAPHCFGYSVRDGVKMANGEMIVIMMADLSDDPKYLKPMWDRMKQGYDIVIGSRFLPGSQLVSYPILKHISNRLFNLAIQFSLLTGITDSSNNFKAFRASMAKKVPLDSASFEVGAELFLRMFIGSAKVSEIPVSWADRAQGKAKFKLSAVFLKYFWLFLKMFKLAYIDRFFGGVKR